MSKIEKHIKKRFLLELDDENHHALRNSYTVDSVEEARPKLKNWNPAKDGLFLITDSGNFIACTPYLKKPKTYVVPIPDFALVYLNQAQIMLREISSARNDMFDKLNPPATSGEKILPEPAVVEVYKFFGIATSFISTLFTAWECYVNQLFPENFYYKHDKDRNTEVYSKEQIVRFLTFDTKVQKALKAAIQRSFYDKPSKATADLNNLKVFRDDITFKRTNSN